MEIFVGVTGDDLDGDIAVGNAVIVAPGLIIGSGEEVAKISNVLVASGKPELQADDAPGRQINRRIAINLTHVIFKKYSRSRNYAFSSKATPGFLYSAAAL